MNKPISLWNLLNSSRVVIPIIQRDYAQGRKGKEYIRKVFLKEIKTAFLERRQLVLDFVYGNNEGDCFYPLDGQQRLTTLWLIHWYLSFISNKLAEDAETLKKFSYETRTSSKDFCIALCDKMKSYESGISIAQYIKEQTWFYSEWLLDPTISAMLRTISGDGDDTEDNIEGVFSGINYADYRSKLINHNIICFNLLEIGHDELPVSDDLYIKMNARGKSLTDFENFKADFVKWLQNGSNTISSKEVDNLWTDVFWTVVNRGSSLNYRIDDAFFAFINRFFLNVICLNDRMNPSDFVDDKKDTKEAKEKAGWRTDFDKLFGTGLASGNSADDGQVKYEGFDVYHSYLSADVVNSIHNVFKALDDRNILEDICSFSRAWIKVNSQDEEGDDSSYYYFPQIRNEDEKTTVKRVTFKNRVFFHAISMFLNRENFVYSDKEKKNLDDWLRVVCNITENSAMEGIPAFVSCLRKIDEMGRGASAWGWEIYKYLNTLNISPKDCNNPLDQQFAEEVAKAKKIIADPEFEGKIIEAENYAFFNGTIRFLIYSESGDVAWNDFDDRFLHAREFFEQDGNEVKLDTIRSLLNTFDDFGSIQGKYLFTKIGYHNRNYCWKKDILCSNDNTILHNVYSLLKYGASHCVSANMAEYYNCFINHNDYLKKIYDNPRSDTFRVHGYRQLAVHRDYSHSNDEYWYIGEECINKNNILHQLCSERKIMMDLDNESYEGFYPGYQISFTVSGVRYGYEYESGSTFKLIGEEKDQDSVFQWGTREELLRKLGINDH